MKSMIAALSFGTLVIAPVTALAGDEFWPAEPVHTSFGASPGEFIVDASANHIVVEPALAAPTFSTTADYVAYMQSQFNAKPILSGGVAVGFELNVKVIGQPYVKSGDELVETRKVVPLMAAGSTGRVTVEGVDICLDLEICATTGTVFTSPPELPGPFYWCEGQLAFEEEDVAAPLGKHFSTAFFDVATIEHDPAFPKREVAVCITPGGLSYLCTRWAERDNELTYNMSYNVNGIVTNVGDSAEDQPALFGSYMLWQAQATPVIATVSAGATHISTNHVQTDTAVTTVP